MEWCWLEDVSGLPWNKSALAHEDPGSSGASDPELSSSRVSINYLPKACAKHLSTHLIKSINNPSVEEVCFLKSCVYFYICQVLYWFHPSPDF